jgi:hypothetical protein
MHPSWSDSGNLAAKRIALVCAFTVVSFGTLGCSSPPEYGEVTGKVTVNDLPLVNVLVTFVPEDRTGHKLPRSMGTTDAQGYYVLRTENSQPGAVVGKHRVIVEDLAIFDAPRTDDGTLLELPRTRFPERFSDLLRSPLSRSVRAGEQQLDLELD